MYKRMELNKLVNAVNICLRKMKSKGSNYTAGMLLDPDQVEGIVKCDEGFRFLKCLRSSAAYWQSRRKELIAMIRQLGFPSIFFTFSAAESKWIELHRILYKTAKGEDLPVDKKLTFQEISELVRNDPVTTVRYFHHKYNVFFSKIVIGLKPLGEVSDYYFRIEMQSRGSCHIHGFLFLKVPLELPILEDNDESGEVDEEAKMIARNMLEILEEKIDEMITCELPDKNDELYELINLQVHHHTRSCKRTVNGVTTCRFNIPYPPMPKTCVLTPLALPEITDNVKDLAKRITEILNEKGFGEQDKRGFDEFLSDLNVTENEYVEAVRSILKQTKVFLKRKPCEVRINGYNKLLLKTWRANLDLQVVLDPFAVVQYVASYVSKSDRGMSTAMRECVDEIRKGNMTVREKLQCISSKFLRASEVSAQEASIYLLQSIPMSNCSRHCIYINTARPEERISMVKSEAELKELDPDSTDICYEGLLDHYVSRPDSLENICLAEFAAGYTFRSDTPKNDKNCFELKNESGFVNKRTKDRIIRYRKYNKLQHKDEFFRSELMLFLPWRCEETELLNVNLEEKYLRMSVTEQFKDNRARFLAVDDDALLEQVENDAEKNESENAQAGKTDAIDDEDADMIVDDQYSIYSTIDTSNYVDPDLAAKEREANSVCETNFYTQPNLYPLEERLNLTQNLNVEQKKIFYHVMHHLKTKQKEPIHLCLTGCAGSGKSVLITALYQNMCAYYNSEAGINPNDIRILLNASTGKASFNIKGITLHSAFRLPVNQNPNMPALGHDLCNTLSIKYEHLKLIIIDEISMVSNRIFNQLDQRLKQIMKCNEPFGNVSVICVGDFNQLKPVAAGYVFESDKGNAYQELIGSVLWSTFKIAYLTEIMRQKDDKDFAIALQNLSSGTMTKAEIELFRSRQYDENNPMLPKE